MTNRRPGGAARQSSGRNDVTKWAAWWKTSRGGQAEGESRTHVESEGNGFVGQRRGHRLRRERQGDQGGMSTVWAPSAKVRKAAERGWAERLGCVMTSSLRFLGIGSCSGGKGKKVVPGVSPPCGAKLLAVKQVCLGFVACFMWRGSMEEGDKMNK